MIDTDRQLSDSLDDAVRMFVFQRGAATGVIPQAPEIAQSLNRGPHEITAALRYLADAKVLILAPHGGEIWAANPFCAVPSGFRVETKETRYWAICAWDALGIVAALHAAQASIQAPCGDCGEPLRLEFRDGALVESEGVIHFAVPARDWWKNIGFA